MKKLSFMLALAAIVANHSTSQLFAQNHNLEYFSISQSRKKKVPMEHYPMTTSTRSLGVNTLRVIQSAENLTIFFVSQSCFTVEVDNSGFIVYSKSYSENILRGQYLINLQGYKSDSYDLKIVLSKDRYYQGNFIIDENIW